MVLDQASLSYALAEVAKFEASSLSQAPFSEEILSKMKKDLRKLYEFNH